MNRLALLATIPDDMPEPYAALAGEHLLRQLCPGHFRARLPEGSPVEWLDFENTAEACVLWFGSRGSANCRPGQWGQQPGITADCLVPGMVIELPSVVEGLRRRQLTQTGLSCASRLSAARLADDRDARAAVSRICLTPWPSAPSIQSLPLGAALYSRLGGGGAWFANQSPAGWCPPGNFFGVHQRNNSG